MGAIIRVRDENGKVTDIPAIVGAPGKNGEPGKKGESGGYYTPSVTQEDDTLRFSFAASEEDMPTVGDVTVSLPGGSVDLDTTLTQSGKAADAKAVGDELAKKQAAGNYLTEIPNDYAKKTDIPSVPTKVSAFTNDAGYVTASAIPAVPAKLPNPNKLTFSGAVSAEYDGSAAVEVMIPQGGGSGGGGGSAEYSLLKTISITEAVNKIVVDLGGTYNELWLFFDNVKVDANAQLGIGVNTSSNVEGIIGSANGAMTTGGKYFVVHLKRLAGANRLFREDTDHSAYGFWQNGAVNRRYADDNSNGISSLCICTSAPTTANYTAGTIKIWGC